MPHGKLVTGVKMGQMVDGYICSAGMNRFDNRDLWRHCYRYMMKRVREKSRTGFGSVGQAPRYDEARVLESIPIAFGEWEQAKEKLGLEERR